MILAMVMVSCPALSARPCSSSIIQHAVRAYETAEMARLRAVLAAVESLTRDTDGGDIDGDANIPIGEIRRVLHEVGPDSSSNHRKATKPHDR